MTTDQWITAGLPLAAVVIAMVRNEIGLAGVERHLSGRIGSLEKVIDARFATVDARFESLEKVIDARFAAVDARFEAARQDLLRVEQVMDARIRHLEDQNR